VLILVDRLTNIAVYGHSCFVFIFGSRWLCSQKDSQTTTDMYKLKLSFFCILALGISPVFGQVYSDKVVGKKNTELADSIKASEYPYILPILGDAATKRGFNLPYSAGLGLNYIWQESDLIIENLQVGFNHNPM